MKKNKLVFFDIPKENLKINCIYRNERLLKKSAAKSQNPETIPDAVKYYSTEVMLPKPKKDRPYVISSIVLSADGKMAFSDSKAGPLIARNNYLDKDGALCDFWTLNMIRAYSDGVLFGTNTLFNEQGISSHVYDRSLNKQRNEVLGKKHHPVGIALSLDGTDIPFDHFVFNIDPKEGYKVMIATSPEGCDYIKKNSPCKHIVYGPFKTKADVDRFRFPDMYQKYDEIPLIVTGSGTKPNTKLFYYILRKMGMETVCIESPTYTSLTLKMGYLDEYFINYSMVYAGGKATPGYSMPSLATDHAHAELMSVGIHQDNFLYTRQKLVYNVTANSSLEKYKY